MSAERGCARRGGVEAESGGGVMEGRRSGWNLLSLGAAGCIGNLPGYHF